MDASPDGCDKRQVVAEALRERGDDFAAFVRARVRPQDVDDVRQLAALRAVERAETLDDPERVVAWLYRIHRNLIVDVARQRARERRFVDAAAGVPEPAVGPPERACGCSVQLAKRIRPSYAAILALVDAEGLKVGDAASRLDVSANNAAVRLHRARKALRQQLLEHCGVVSPDDCADCRCTYEDCCAA